MRSSFREYYSPSADEMASLWSHAVIVPDANALLNLYRYSKSTSEEFLQLLERIKERLWIPHQVGLEYQRNRMTVISELDKAYEKLEDDLKKTFIKLKALCEERARHPVIKIGALKEILQRSEIELLESIAHDKSEHDSNSISKISDDPIRDRLTEILDGRVGPSLSDEELGQIYEQGKTRYDTNTPPGFNDKGKPEPQRYGDLIIWMQLLSHVKDSPSPVLFLTDDQKEDWWLRFEGKLLGPRTELLREFYGVCEQPLHFLTPQLFLELASKHLDISVDSESIDEISAVSDEQSRRESIEEVRSRIERLRDVLAQTQFHRMNLERAQGQLEHAKRELALGEDDQSSLERKLSLIRNILRAREFTMTEKEQRTLSLFDEPMDDFEALERARDILTERVHASTKVTEQIRDLEQREVELKAEMMRGRQELELLTQWLNQKQH